MNKETRFCPTYSDSDSVLSGSGTPLQQSALIGLQVELLHLCEELAGLVLAPEHVGVSSSSGGGTTKTRLSQHTRVLPIRLVLEKGLFALI